MKNLSKSRYTLFRQCPKALWLKIYKPEVAAEDRALEARFAEGNVIGDLAMGYLGPYEEVTVHTPEGGLDLSEMCRKTQDCMARGVENIAEASFSWDGNYCAVDILHKTPGGWAIYEVKSSSGTVDMPEDDQDYVKYARDIAYQKYVLEQCGVKVTGTYLVRIDKDYVRGDELDIKGLFYTADLSELVQQEYQVVPQMIAAAKKALAGPEPNIDLGLQCHDPYNCAFWDYCSRHLPKPSVFNVYGGKGRGGFTFSKKLEHYHNGLVTFDDIRNEDLGPIQNMQIECTLEGKDHINPEGIKAFLDKLTYPLYFLDFETQQDAVPQYPGTQPYQQIPFQYSLHIIEYEGGPLLHKEFLGISGKDPRRDIAEALCRDIPKDVCTLAYNKSFECGRLRELANTFPDLSDHLRNIANNIQDLIDPFRAGDYYVPAMGGSFSIKSVLPALFPNDPQLDYHALSNLCQNGGDAMNLFPSIAKMASAEATAAREALLRYCELDTLAMVKVWEKLKERCVKIKNEITNKTFYMATPQKIIPRNLSLDLNECKDLPRSEKLKSIKAFMDAVTESDFGNSEIEFPHAGDFEYDESFVRFKCVPYFKLAGLQDVICEFHYWPDYFNFEYHKREALLKCNDDGELLFYPFTNDIKDYVVDLDLDETAYITFKKLTISALAEYFKLMPLIFPLD